MQTKNELKQNGKEKEEEEDKFTEQKGSHVFWMLKKYPSQLTSYICRHF